MGRGPPQWLCSLASLFVMRVCMSINFNAVRSIRITDYTWDAGTQQCVFHRRSRGEVDFYQVPIYLVEFFLPVLGGLAVDKWFGELKVLRVAGVLLLLSGLYVTAVEMGNLICKPMVYMLGLVPSCLAYGIGVAPLVAAPLKLSHGRFGSPTPGLLTYYASASLGEAVGFLPSYARSSVNLTWVVCVSPAVYIAASGVLRLDWAQYRRRVRHQLDEHGFLFPTRGRLLRYFVLLAPLVLLVSVIGNVRCLTYCMELNYYLNCTGNCTEVMCAEVFGAYNFSAIGVILLLGAMYKAGWLAREGRIHARFYAGASILLLSKAALIPWNWWAAAQTDLPNPDLTHAVYGAASGMDGLTIGLAMASGYELMYRIAPAHSKSLVMGVLFTIWAIGALATGLMLKLLLNFPHGHPVLKPVFGESNKVYIAYVVMAAEAAMMMIYYRCFSVRLASPMIPVDDEGDDLLGTEEPTSSSRRLLANAADMSSESASVKAPTSYGAVAT